MGLDGGEADAEGGRRLLVRPPLGQEVQDLLFAVGEEVVGILEAALLELPDVVLEERSSSVASLSR
jgi:hypothetical protein